MWFRVQLVWPERASGARDLAPAHPPPRVIGLDGRGRAMPVPKVSVSDIVNELNGANDLLLSLGGDRESTLKTLFMSFNSRIANLGQVDSTVMPSVIDAITNGPWTERQASSLIAVLESIGTTAAKPDAKPFQHCLRCNAITSHTCTMHSRAVLAIPRTLIHASCAREIMQPYTRELCSHHRFENFITQEEWAKLRGKPIVHAACGMR